MKRVLVAISLLLAVVLLADSSDLSLARTVSATEVKSVTTSTGAGLLRAGDEDVNGDCVVNLLDVNAAADAWRASPGDPNWNPDADVNPDSVINVVDILRIVRRLGQSCGPPPVYGVQMFGEVNDSTVQNRAAQANMAWVRLGVQWRNVQPNKNDPYNWDAYDTMFANANDAGLAVHAVIGNSPEWAVEDVTSAQGVYKDCGPVDPEDLPALADFVEAFVERYDGDDVDDPAVVAHVEFWNEADAGYNGNTNCDWVGGCWGGDRDNDGIPDPEEYATMLTYAYPAVKAANTDTKALFSGIAYEDGISGGCFNMGFADQVLTKLEDLSATGDAGEYFDVMNVHQYDFRRGTWDGTSPDKWGILGKTSAVRSILNSHGLSTTPIVVSEVGLNADPDPADPDQDLKASHVVREFVRAASAWPTDILSVIWFQMIDCRDTFSKGLLECDTLVPYDAYQAYKTLTNELSGYEFDQRFSVAGNDRIQAYAFCIKEGGSCKAGVSKKLVLWRDEEGKKIKWQSTTATESMNVSATHLEIWTGNVRVVKKLGGETFESGGSSVNLTFGISPIIVEAVP